MLPLATAEGSALPLLAAMRILAKLVRDGVAPEPTELAEAGVEADEVAEGVVAPEAAEEADWGGARDRCCCCCC